VINTDSIQCDHDVLACVKYVNFSASLFERCFLQTTKASKKAALCRETARTMPL